MYIVTKLLHDDHRSPRLNDKYGLWLGIIKKNYYTTLQIELLNWNLEPKITPLPEWVDPFAMPNHPLIPSPSSYARLENILTNKETSPAHIITMLRQRHAYHIPPALLWQTLQLILVVFVSDSCNTITYQVPSYLDRTLTESLSGQNRGYHINKLY